jgi:DNA repair protein RecN (Recombination protein N)
MLQSLKVKNFALISDVELFFDQGMNIITGETGAGKSILIGALGLALGNRADLSSLRNKEAKCVIEATFDISNYDLKSFFHEFDLDYEPITLIRREITTSGKSRAFINDTPVNLKELNDLGSQLIEIHSQYDNLQLFKKEFQFYSLDALADAVELFQMFSGNYKSYRAQLKNLETLRIKQAELAKESSFNQFLFDELTAAELEKIDEVELTSEQEMLENAEDLIRAFGEADQLLSGSEVAVLEQINLLKRVLASQKTVLTSTLAERVQSVLIELQDINNEVNKAVDGVEVNPERLEQVNERLALIFNLKSKHRLDSVTELIQLRNELDQKLGETNDLGTQIKRLEEDLKQQLVSLTMLANDLHKKRAKAIPGIEKELNEALGQLGMQHSRIKYELSLQNELSEYGFDLLTLQLSSDKGHTLNDLKKSASGGELARINLSLKNKLARFVQMPSSIFDEIDTGVSGEIARKVGGMMQEMSGNQQVIVITHLPQIASLGKNHLFVYKSENKETVETQVRTLNGDERITEIAKMISGDNLTEHALEQSKELLKG